MRYKNLNDAAKNPKVKDEYRRILSPGDIRIWYSRSDWPGQFWGIESLPRLPEKVSLPTPQNIWDSHVKLGAINGAAGRYDAPALEVIFAVMQGENWSPRGEARDLITSKGLRHTSMSVGDIIQPPDGTLWYVDSFGFEKIWPRSNPRSRGQKRKARNNPDARAILRRAMRGT
jgi:hypothetical protein